MYLHAMIRDKYGRKMSKSLGNVIDPLEVINGCTLEAMLEKIRHGNLDPSEVEKASQGKAQDFPTASPCAEPTRCASVCWRTPSRASTSTWTSSA